MTWLIDPPFLSYLPPALLHSGLRSVRHALRQDVEQLTPSPSIYRALSRAEDRSKAIQNFLGEGSSPTQEFVEVPPGFAERSERHFEKEGAAAGQAARLVRQLNRLPLLLLDRVVDAVVVFERNANRPVRETLRSTAIRIDRALDHAHSRMSAVERRVLSDQVYFADREQSRDDHSEFSFYWRYPHWERYVVPFRVVVETDSRPLREFLLSETLSDWFGIGIDVAPASSP
jgi:hypothetical protein